MGRRKFVLGHVQKNVEKLKQSKERKPGHPRKNKKVCTLWNHVVSIVKEFFFKA